MSSHQSVGAIVAIEHATARAVELLESRDVPSIVLRGPVLVSLLYERLERRISIDVDLLVPDLEAGSVVLQEAGFVRIVDWTPATQRHAWTHMKPDAISVDLHQTLVGVGVEPDAVWSIFERESEFIDLAGVDVRAPNEPAQALSVALHAAQHGRAGRQPLEDLRRAVERFGREVWEAAAKIALELQALPAFHAGLLLVPRGERLIRDIGLPAQTSRTTALRAEHGTALPAVLALDEALALRGRARMTFAIGKLFPSPAFMRQKYRLATRGPLGLGTAYLYRLGWIGLAFPRGLRRLLAAERRTRR